MPFDGRTYDGTPIRRALYSPGAVLSGDLPRLLLEGAYACSRQRGRRMLAQTWPRNFQGATGGNAYFLTANLITASTQIAKDRRYVPAHYTHVMAHFCFTILDGADIASFTLSAKREVSMSWTNASTQTIPVSGNAPALKVTNGAIFEGKGQSYETTMRVPLIAVASGGLEPSQTGLSLPGIVEVKLEGYAYTSDPTGGVSYGPGTMVMDSLSMWLESIG